LAAGNSLALGELDTSFLRLYEFILHSLTEPRSDQVRDAIKILHTLRDGFRAVRKEAQDLERGGTIPHSIARTPCK
jgi:hypothetical protein